MTKREIVDEIARHRGVETMVENIAGQPLAGDLKDLAQMVYLILLEYDDGKVVDLWEHHQMNFFIARIILNQYRSSNSPFYKQCRKFLYLTQEIDHDKERLDYWREAGRGISGLQVD